MLDRFSTTLPGIKGFLANLDSHATKAPVSKTPMLMGPSTAGELHGKTTPPRFRPSRISTVRVMMPMLPSQSNAFRPALSSVLGLWTSKKAKVMAKAQPDSGRLIHQFQRQLRCSVIAPPMTGPNPLASAQINPVILRKRPRALHLCKQVVRTEICGFVVPH
jgi:hypothetical protein